MARKKKKREENGLFLPARNLGKHFTCLLLHDFLALDVGGWVVSSSCLSSLPLKGIHCTVAHKSFGIYGVAPLPPSLPSLEAAAKDNNKQPKKRREENNFFGTGWQGEGYGKLQDPLQGCKIVSFFGKVQIYMGLQILILSSGIYFFAHLAGTVIFKIFLALPIRCRRMPVIPRPTGNVGVSPL